MTFPGSSVRFPALGTTAVVAVTEPRALEVARGTVECVVDAFDRACSRFREDSELYALNSATGDPTPASPLLLDAVQAALRAARLTDGAVDPTIGDVLIALGYDRDFSDLRPGARPRVAVVPGWQTVEVNPQTATIRLGRGVKLDLGATAKALAADRAATAALQATGSGVLVALGGDIAIAGPAPEPGWRVRVTDDHAAGVRAPGQWIWLQTGGLATSSITVRRWTARDPQGQDFSVHHLLDPATGAPVSGPWRTVSIAGESCLDANIASTAAIVRGEHAVAWLGGLGFPSRLVGTDGIARHVAGWPAEGDDLADSAVRLPGAHRAARLPNTDAGPAEVQA